MLWVQVGVCDGLVLDASASSGGGGRMLGFQWGVEATEGESVNVKVALQRAVEIAADNGTPEIVALGPAGLQAGRSYIFFLQVTNIMGAVGSTDSQVTKSKIPMPYVSVYGG